MIKDKVATDLKAAMLSGDKRLVEVLRGIKSSILNAEIAGGSRDAGLSEDEVIKVLQKESKRRTDAIELYTKAGETERADNESYEKQVIDGYLPEQMSEADLNELIESAIAELGVEPNMQAMGKVIGSVKAKAGGAADGVLIAKLVQQKLNK